MAWDDITQFSWLHPRRSPAENLALGAQTGATIRSAWTQRHADTRAAQMLPYQMYAAEQQARNDAYQVNAAMLKLKEDEALNSGLTELSKITADAAEKGNWDTPEFQSKVRGLGIKYPKMTMTQPYLAALGQGAVARKERMQLLKDLADIEATQALAEQRRSGRTAAGLGPLNLMRAATELRQEAAELRKSSDPANIEEAQRLDREANVLDSRARGNQQTIEVTPGGGTRITSGPVWAATTSFQTDIQKRQMVMELGTEAATELLSRIRPEDVGVAGWVGGNVYPFVRQINPNVGDMQVIPNRMALGEFGELLKSGLSAEDVSRLTEGDVKRLHKIGTDLLDPKLDYKTIVERIQESKNIFKRRSRAYAERTGQPIPDAHKEKDEVKADYDRAVEAAQRQLQANEITAVQHDEAVTSAYRRLQESMRRFHNTIVTGQ